MRFPVFFRFLIPGLGLLASGPATGQHVWQRATRLDGGVFPQHVAVDGQANSIVAGLLDDTVAFGATTLTGAGSGDVFVAQLTPANQWGWAISVGSPQYDAVSAVAVDGQQNIYVAGQISGTVTFGGTTLTPAGASGLFVGKLSSQGQWLWATTAAGSGTSTADGLALDPATGDLVIGGSFTDSLICGTDTLRNNGRTSGYVARLSGSTGAWRWAKRTGNTVNTVTVSALAVAPGGDIVAMGSFDSHFDWDGTLVPNSYNYPLTWVGAVTPAGQLSWVAQTTAAPPTPSSFGTTVGRSVAVDGQGNVYMTGIFSGLATFGATTLNSVTSQQSMDGFVARLDGATHQWSWAVGGGTVADDEMGNVVVDGAGPSVYVTGTSASGVSGGGPTLPATYGPFTLPGSGASDLFVARLNAATGAWEELLAATGSQREWGLELAREPVAGSFVVAGWTEDGVTRFGPIPLGGGAGTQGFVARFGLPLGVREGKALAGAPDVWPNPARGTARIRLGQEEEGPLALLDAVGRPVRTVELAEGQREATLDLQGLPAGLYLLRAGGRSRRLVVE